MAEDTQRAITRFPLVGAKIAKKKVDMPNKRFSQPVGGLTGGLDQSCCDTGLSASTLWVQIGRGDEEHLQIDTIFKAQLKAVRKLDLWE